MKNLLIIYPHWPPSNLAGIHRARLIANFLPELDWKPTVLTVSSKYYEEKPDHDLLRTVDDRVEVIHVKAFPTLRYFRVIGDIGIRAFPFIYKKAVELLDNNHFDFIWIPIPSFYLSLMGRLLKAKSGVKYGIDYIDPWVRPLALHESWISKAGISRLFARFLEPIAIKRASLISGVSEAYYMPAIVRNKMKNRVIHVSMPYGFDPGDHEIQPSEPRIPWDEADGKINLVYAGAFLPKSHMFLKTLFTVIQRIKESNAISTNFHLYFLGTGSYGGKQISEYAIESEVDDVVTEVNERIPYLNVLHILSKADAIMVIGSTEKHYTASKTFQAILSKRPVFAILHRESTAIKVLVEVKADDFIVPWDEDKDFNQLSVEIELKLTRLLESKNRVELDIKQLESYSSLVSAKKLIEGIERT